MTTEQDPMRKLVFNELTQLISEVKIRKKSTTRPSRPSTSNSKRLSKYGNTLSPQQLPRFGAPMTTRSSVLSQNKLQSSTTQSNTSKQSKTVEIPSLLPTLSTTTQRASYKTVKGYDDFDSSSNYPNLKWNGNTPLEKLVENEVSKRLDKHLQSVSEQTHKLYLDSRDQIRTMTKQLHDALEQVNESKRQYDSRSNELAKLISLLKDNTHQFLTHESSFNSHSQSGINTGSESYESYESSYATDNRAANRRDSTAKKSFKQKRVRSASAGAKQTKVTNKRPTTAAISHNKTKTKPKTKKIKPELTKVSIHSSFRESSLSVAIAGLDQVIFEIESNVGIRRPIIKLWPKLSNFHVHRYNPELIQSGSNSKKWIFACKLSRNSPVGPVSFVINYQSIDNNIIGNAVHNTTDGTFCVVNSNNDEVASQERRNSHSSQDVNNVYSSQQTKLMHNSKSEKKLSKKSKLKTNFMGTRDRTRPQTHHTNNKNSMYNAKKSKKRNSKKNQRKYIFNNKTFLNGEDYDNMMEQYANNLLNNEHHAQWQ